MADELVTGIRSLYESKQYTDFTVIAGEAQFAVHKLVLVATSGYFRKLFRAGMREALLSNFVEFPQFEPAVVSNVLHRLYYGKFKVPLDVTWNELYVCADYLEVETAAHECTDSIISEDLSTDNWYDVLCFFQRYSAESGVARTKAFCRSNSEEILCSIGDDMDVDVLERVIEIWQKTEFELYTYISDWISLDRRGRLKYEEKLYGEVRFGLLCPAELDSIKETEAFQNRNGDWKGLLELAEKYNRLADDCLKVPFYEQYDMLEQIKCRGEPDSITFLGRQRPLRMHVYNLQESRWWVSEAAECTSDSLYNSDIISVNGFLIYMGPYQSQMSMLDTRAMQWTEMPPAPEGKICAATLYRSGKLYVTGGKKLGFGLSLSRAIDVFDFATAEWETLRDVRLPVAVACHGACSLGKHIYVAGGFLTVDTGPHRLELDRFDVDTGEWRSSGPLPTDYDTTDLMLQVFDKDTLAYLNEDCNLSCYNTRLGQWNELSLPYNYVYRDIDHQPYMFIAKTVVYVYSPHAKKLHVYRRHQGEVRKHEEIHIENWKDIPVIVDIPLHHKTCDYEDSDSDAWYTDEYGGCTDGSSEHIRSDASSDTYDSW